MWRSLNPSEVIDPGDNSISLETAMPTDVAGLLAALRRLCASLTGSDKRLCFFIDGLDEYEGDSSDIIELIGVLRAFDHVKICVSSRQWNEFEAAFGKAGSAKLYMQDFNDEDIIAYINDIFANNDDYQELEDRETRGKALVEEIVRAAQGVFLWVILVVRSFVEGLREGDSISRLQNRLRELPTKLEEYFERILFHDVKTTYRDQAAQMFLVALAAKDTLPLMAYWFLDECDLPTERRPLKMQQTNKRHKDAKKRLIASCKGLLEPRFQSPNGGGYALPSAILFDFKVDFLHRTVRDYLTLPTTDIKHWAPPSFDPHEAICRVLYSQIMTAPVEDEYIQSIATLHDVFKCHSESIQTSIKDCDGTLLLQARLQEVCKPKAKAGTWEAAEKGLAIAVDASTCANSVTDSTAITAENGLVSPWLSEAPERRPSPLKKWISRLSVGQSKVAGDKLAS